MMVPMVNGTGGVLQQIQLEFMDYAGCPVSVMSAEPSTDGSTYRSTDDPSTDPSANPSSDGLQVVSDEDFQSAMNYWQDFESRENPSQTLQSEVHVLFFLVL